ncbi:MAG: choice-of-anchor J domain-containing protein [Bacteroidales bacterium]|nr:choice-of-anchor J domain-containing protein [Bacteroidales bacterium]
MKRIAILLIGVSMLLLSCKKDLGKPDIKEFPSGNEWTVGQILDTLANGSFIFDKESDRNATVKGYVIADESGGNVYRTLYLRGTDGRCIAIYRKGASDGGSDAFNVKVGDYIGYALYGSVISEYSKLPQIQVQEHDVNDLIVIYERGCYDKVQPVSTTISRIEAGEHLCDLVRLDNVQFETYEGLTYADGTSNTNRSLVSCSGESIIVRTSGYASFASALLPSGKGNLFSIVSVYNTTWQLLVRTLADVNLVQSRCGEGGEVMELPYIQSFSSSFGTYTTENVIGDQVWYIDYSAATMTGHVSEGGQHYYYANEDWLISSPVDLQNVDKAVMCVNYGAKYFNNINNEVTFWISDDYVFDSIPTSATWTQIPAQIQNNDFNFTDVELAIPVEYIGKIVNVAVKYTSSDTAAGTIEIKSVTLREGEPAPQPQVIFSEPFSQGQGEFTINNVYLAPGLGYVWKFNASYGMVASAFTNNTSYQSDSWLISPSIDMSDYNSAVFTFDHAANKLSSGSPSDFYFVMVSTDYDPTSPDDAHWTKLEVPNYPVGTNWTFVSSGEIDMSAYLGYDNVHVAFKYTSETDNSGSWEIKNVLIKER